MKRQYISPSIYTRKVVFRSLMAGSPGVTDSYAQDNSTEEDAYSGAVVGGTNYGNGGHGLSKGGWFDDDESIW